MVRYSRLLLVPAAMLIAAGSYWVAGRPRTPDPVDIASLGPMDPEVASLLGELRDTVERDRGDAAAWGRLAMACEANGFVGASRAGYSVASQLAPDEPRWTYRLALVTSRLGDTDTALAALARTNELAPEYGPAWSRRGQWLLDRGDTPAAEAAFRRALSIHAHDLAASIGLARVHLERREPGRAADVLEQVLGSHPGDRYALQLLGTAYRRLGRITDAEVALAVGADGEPAWNDPWSEEIGEYRRGFATRLKSATAEALAGRFDRALPMLAELRRQRPGDVALIAHTADVLTAAGRFAEAIDLLRPVVEAQPDNAEAQVTLASAYFASGRLAPADVHASRAIALRASGSRAHEIKGLLAWRGRRLHEAVTWFEEGRARDPRDARLGAWIGLIALENGRAAAAAATFDDVLRRQPTQPDALAGLALAQAALGNREEAALALSRAEQVAPDHPRVRHARERLTGAGGLH